MGRSEATGERAKRAEGACGPIPFAVLWVRSRSSRGFLCSNPPCFVIVLQRLGGETKL